MGPCDREEKPVRRPYVNIHRMRNSHGARRGFWRTLNWSATTFWEVNSLSGGIKWKKQPGNSMISLWCSEISWNRLLQPVKNNINLFFFLKCDTNLTFYAGVSSTKSHWIWHLQFWFAPLFIWFEIGLVSDCVNAHIRIHSLIWSSTKRSCLHQSVLIESLVKDCSNSDRECNQYMRRCINPSPFF